MSGAVIATTGSLESRAESVHGKVGRVKVEE